MKIITDNDIQALGISPAQCVDWVRESFLMKNRATLPPKISLHPRGDDFINTMPCLLPEEYGIFGCKIVSRIRGSVPSLKSKMLMVDSTTGDDLALIDTDWITAMRTGAVAALAIDTLQRKNADIYAFVGLGVIGHAVLKCLAAINPGRKLRIRLKRYKDHAEKMMEEFADYDNLAFEIADDMELLVRDADVVVSCITSADGLLVEDLSLFKPGVLVVPVHTRGFQNCDGVFHRVVADDTGHVRGFRYFDLFHNFTELSDVLADPSKGRQNDEERILAYNIGIALHDVVFGKKILDMTSETETAK